MELFAHFPTFPTFSTFPSFPTFDTFLTFLTFPTFPTFSIFLIFKLFLLFLLFLRFYFSYFSYIFSLICSRDFQKHITLRPGVRDKNHPPPHSGPPAPPWGPPYRSLEGYGVWGLGYFPRITNVILKVKSLSKIFYSIRIRAVNQSCPLKILWPPI